MVDSGADNSFIDMETAKRVDLSLMALKQPRRVEGMNGRALAIVRYRRVPLTLLVSGNHREQIKLFILPTFGAAVILGSPWLAKHNPRVDWAARTVTAWSMFCHGHCLCSALPPTNRTVPQGLTVADLARVPKEYHDLVKAFSKGQALSLPLPLGYSQGHRYPPASFLTSPAQSGRPWRIMLMCCHDNLRQTLRTANQRPY